VDEYGDIRPILPVLLRRFRGITTKFSGQRADAVGFVPVRAYCGFAGGVMIVPHWRHSYCKGQGPCGAPPTIVDPHLGHFGISISLLRVFREADKRGPIPRTQ
jgi:hypothetical protein